jgi:hypothetical protein
LFVYSKEWPHVEGMETWVGLNAVHPQTPRACRWRRRAGSHRDLRFVTINQFDAFADHSMRLAVGVHE